MIRVIRLMSAGPPVSVGKYDGAYFENGPTNHSFVWDEKGTIYLSRVSNSVAKVQTGTGMSVLYSGNGTIGNGVSGNSYSWSGRCGIYDVTYLWKGNGGTTKYVDLQRFARANETLIRQDVFLIIVSEGIFCPVNLDIA